MSKYGKITIYKDDTSEIIIKNIFGEKKYKLKYLGTKRLVDYLKIKLNTCKIITLEDKVIIELNSRKTAKEITKIIKTPLRVKRTNKHIETGPIITTTALIITLTTGASLIWQTTQTPYQEQTILPEIQTTEINLEPESIETNSKIIKVEIEYEKILKEIHQQKNENTNNIVNSNIEEQEANQELKEQIEQPKTQQNEEITNPENIQQEILNQEQITDEMQPQEKNNQQKQITENRSQTQPSQEIEQQEQITENNSEIQIPIQEEIITQIPEETYVITNTFNIGSTKLNGCGQYYNTATQLYSEAFNTYGNMYGIDPELLAYIGAHENYGKHSETKNSGGALGLCQLQVSWIIVDKQLDRYGSIQEEVNAKILTCYNFNTCTYDKILPVTETGLERIKNANIDLTGITLVYPTKAEDNIRTCAAMLAINLKTFNNDIVTATIAYNQGIYATKGYINKLADAKGISFETAIKDYEWIDYIPNGYGNNNYIKDILKHAIESENNQITCNYLDELGNISETQLTITGDNIVQNQGKSR